VSSDRTERLVRACATEGLCYNIAPVRAIDETTVLITGATNGLGRAVADRLVAET
jgi:hypothetical protein